MRTLRQDLQFGLRMLRNSPGFTIVAVFTLALGIAVTTTVFSWMDAVLLHPFPGVGDARGLFLLETVTPGPEYLVNTSYMDYRDYRANLKLVSGLAIGRFTPLSVGANGKTQRAWAELVSDNYFEVMQVKPALGRIFLADEQAVVISHQTWRNRFHEDAKVLGKTIRLNRHELTIVGVAPPEFQGSLVGVEFDVWMPIAMAPAMGTGKGTLGYRGTRDLTSTLMRLKPGVTPGEAGAEARALARRLAEQYPDTNRGVDIAMTPVSGGHLGAQAMLLKPLQILMAVCVLALLIVCANVANLLLARAVSRQREFGIRRALGAHRKRLGQQLLTETMLLAGGGTVVGVTLAMWLGPALVWLLPSLDVPLNFGGTLSLSSMLFTVATAAAATLGAGMAPAIISAGVDVNETLKEGGRGGGTGTHAHRMRGALVVVESALAMIALVGAGLFYRSFQSAGGIHPGFDTTNTSVSQFYLSNAGYSGREQRQFCRTLRERMEATPGVKGVTYSDVAPLTSPSGSTPWHQVEVEGYVPGPNEQPMIHRAMVPPGYFRFMSIPLLEGRDFTERDETGKPLVIVVNQTFARRFFGGANPVGRKLKFDGDKPATVVGLVKDSKYHTPMERPMPFFYVAFQQRFEPGLNFLVLLRTEGDPSAMTATLRREALALNQDAVFQTRLMTDAVTSSLYPQKVAAFLLGAVGLLCVLLAAVGLYSVMSYAVNLRKQELGIRMALGARPGVVGWMVVREGLALALPGLLAGLVVALAAARLVGGMLVEVDAADPLTFGVSALLLGAVAALASYLPALRATRVEPMSALRG